MSKFKELFVGLVFGICFALEGYYRGNRSWHARILRKWKIVP